MWTCPALRPGLFGARAQQVELPVADAGLPGGLRYLLRELAVQGQPEDLAHEVGRPRVEAEVALDALHRPAVGPPDPGEHHVELLVPRVQLGVQVPRDVEGAGIAVGRVGHEAQEGKVGHRGPAGCRGPPVDAVDEEVGQLTPGKAQGVAARRKAAADGNHLEGYLGQIPRGVQRLDQMVERLPSGHADLEPVASP